ncbi:MAG: SpoIIE family protein phosphatase [Acidobacteriota bacterium]|nr:MAG: SpoIIE family protein phosphatase [Acidobacteriota bacterium]
MSSLNRTGRIRTLLVDDEVLARQRLRDLLDHFAVIEIVGEAENGDQAIERIASLQPDLVFLDIQMPGRNGLQVATGLMPPRPAVVFCTAFDQYAVDAFEQNAVDYLLKPVSRTRLARCLERIAERLGRTTEADPDLQRAEETQARLFPQTLPVLESLEDAGACVPARRVGGDYYDFLSLGGDRLGLALADVSGKGLSAALLMASLQGRLQSSAVTAPSVGNLVRGLNRAMCASTDSGRFVTLFYGVYSDQSRILTYTNAGHNPAVLVRPDGSWQPEVKELTSNSIVIGVFPDAGYAEESIVIEPGDYLVLYTDGVTEAMDGAGSEFGLDRLKESIVENLGDTPAELCHKLKCEVMDYSGGEGLHDDLTLVVARGV